MARTRAIAGDTRRTLHFAHAYGYAGAIAQMLRHTQGKRELAKFLDTDTPTFRAALRGPQRRSILHDLLRDMALHDWQHDVSHWLVEPLDQFFRDHGETIPSRLLRETEGNQDKLESLLERPVAKLVDAAFYLLFGDRRALLDLGQVLAELIRPMSPDRFPELRRPGVPQRPKYIPAWLKSAVYHRDQGRCQICHRDLSGLIYPVSDAQLDHIWPLAQSGSNDVTNFQLLCARCNGRKHAQDGRTSEVHYVYW